MVRLCSESSRSYSGRPAIAPRRQRRERGSAMAVERVQESAEAVVPRATSRGTPGGTHNSGRAELGRQNTTIGGLVPGAMKPTGRALGSDHRGRERVAALSVRTARNRRTRTRMSGGVGGGREIPPPTRFGVSFMREIRRCNLSNAHAPVESQLHPSSRQASMARNLRQQRRRRRTGGTQPESRTPDIALAIALILRGFFDT